jgi:hypothetical protein
VVVGIVVMVVTAVWIDSIVKSMSPIPKRTSETFFLFVFCATGKTADNADKNPAGYLC